MLLCLLVISALPQKRRIEEVRDKNTVTRVEGREEKAERLTEKQHKKNNLDNKTRSCSLCRNGLQFKTHRVYIPDSIYFSLFTNIYFIDFFRIFILSHCLLTKIREKEEAIERCVCVCLLEKPNKRERIEHKKAVRNQQIRIIRSMLFCYIIIFQEREREKTTERKQKSFQSAQIDCLMLKSNSILFFVRQMVFVVSIIYLLLFSLPPSLFPFLSQNCLLNA